LLLKSWLAQNDVEQWERERLSKEDAGEIDSGDEVPVPDTHQESLLDSDNDADAEEL
jgi:hypothetical protein